MNQNNQSKTNPLVSILIPVYNRINLVEEAVTSALNQDYSNLEVVIGDNCSTDGTFEYLQEKYGERSNIIVFRNKENLGPVGNWEECLKRCSGKYVKILWSDDLIDPSFVSKSLKLLETDPEISFVYSSVLCFHHPDELKDRKAGSKEIIRYRLGKTGIRRGNVFISKAYKQSYCIPVSPGCAIFRRNNLHIAESIPNAIGYNHRKTGAGTDLFIFFQALENGERFAYIDEPLNFFREHEGSITCSDNRIIDGYWSAKISFAAAHPKIRKLTTYLNSDMVSVQQKKNVFHPKAIHEFLNYYYGDSPYRYSLFNVLRWGVIREFYMLGDYLKQGDKHELFGTWRKRFLGK